MKKKEFCEAPEGVKYVSDWDGFVNPKGHVIVNKTITGCGYTEFCLRNNVPTILASPRVALLVNKFNQHYGESNVFYFKNEIGTSAGVVSALEELSGFLLSNIGGGIPKILVTYDSLDHVLGYLGSAAKGYQVVIDEFQSIFTDAQFKPSVGIKVMNDIKKIPNVIFLSATPMLDKYLDMVPDFDDVDYFEIRWPLSQVTPVSVNVIRCASLVKEISKVIQNYKEGKYPCETNDSGQIIQSTELVVFVNNVKLIKDIISKNGLVPEEVNVLCADNPENLREIAKAFGKKPKNFTQDLCSIPLQGQPHKMFTFCTATIYIGADFYSTNATTYVLSDGNIKSMGTDVVLDLPQIAGRQRLRENVFRRNITVFFKTLRTGNQVNEDTFRAQIIRKENDTFELLGLIDGKDESDEAVGAMGRLCLRAIKNSIIEKAGLSERVNYLAIVDEKSKVLNICYNYLLKAAEERAFDVIQGNYRSCISISNAVSTSSISKPAQDVLNTFSGTPLDDLIGRLNGPGDFEDKLKDFCIEMDQYPWPWASGFDHSEEAVDFFIRSKTYNKKFLFYYRSLGTERCKSLKYQDSYIKKTIEDLIVKGSSDEFYEDLKETFKEQRYYSRADIKDLLKGVYQRQGINATAKATDIGCYFEATESTKMVKGVRSKGYEVGPIKVRP